VTPYEITSVGNASTAPLAVSSSSSPHNATAPQGEDESALFAAPCRPSFIFSASHPPQIK